MAWSSLCNTRWPKFSVYLPLSHKYWDYKHLSLHLDYNFYFLLQIIKPLGFHGKQIFPINQTTNQKTGGLGILVQEKWKLLKNVLSVIYPFISKLQHWATSPNLACHSTKCAKTKPWFYSSSLAISPQVAGRENENALRYLFPLAATKETRKSSPESTIYKLLNTQATLFWNSLHPTPNSQF